MNGKLYLGCKILMPVFVLVCLISLCGCNNKDRASGSKDNIEYLSMWNTWEPQAEYFKQMSKKFEEETGIQVKIDFIGRNVLTKVKSRFRMGDPPDLTDQDFNEIEAAISSKYLEAIDLTNVLYSEELTEENIKLKDVFDNNLLDLYANDNKMYYFPYEFITSGFFYNKNLYKQYGLSAPANWDQFMSNSEILYKNNISPMASDGSVNFYNAYYYCWLVQRILGTGALKEAAMDKDGSTWDNPGYLEAAKMVYELSKAGKYYFQKEYSESEWPNAQIEWAKGKSGSLLCSTWIPSETKAYKIQDFSYGFYPFPEVIGGKGKSTDIEVAFIGCVIPKGAKNANNAVAFLKFISKKENAQKFSEITDTISARKDVDYPENLADVQKYRERMTASYMSYDGVWMDMPEWWTNVFLTLNDQLFFGEIEPEKFIEKIKKESAAFWAR